MKHWEVTSSPYLLSVCPIIYEYEDTYSIDEDGVTQIIDDLQNIVDELQDKLDSMPDQLQDSDTGTLLQERIDGLEEAISELESIDIDDLKQDALDSEIDDIRYLLKEEDDDSDTDDDDDDNDDIPGLEDFDTAVETLQSQGKEEAAQSLYDTLEESIKECISSALDNILEE